MAIRVLYLLTDQLSAVLVRGQLGALIEHGFEVTVGTRTHEGGVEFDPGVVVVDVPFAREPSPLADIRALWHTVRLIRRVRPDTVNASTPKAGLLGMLAARMCRVPVRIYVVRGLRFETATGWRRRAYRATEWMAIRSATAVIFNSRSLLAVGEREGVIGPGRGTVLGAGSGNGVDTSRFTDDRLPSRDSARRQFGLPSDALVVGFVGRFTRDKGIADLVEAFTEIAGADARVWLLLVGAFEVGDPIDATTRRTIDAHDRIATVEWVDHPGAAYRAMDLLAFPSYREGLPNVPLEAQACGVPVVGYAATGTVDAVSDGRTGVLTPVGDVGSLRDAMGALLDDPDRRRHLGRSAQQWVADEFAPPRIWNDLAARSRPTEPREGARRGW